MDELLKLKRDGLVRGRRVINHPIRLLLVRIVDLFCGGRKRRDQAAFLEIYPDLLKITGVKQLLQVHARFELSGMKKSLEGTPFYNRFLQRIKLTQDAAKKKSIDPWIQATDFERLFATYFERDRLPLRAVDVPRGAILLTHVDSMLTGYKLKGHKLRFRQRLKHIKAFLFKLFTGESYIHAVLSLGNGEFFHLDKRGDAYGGVIQDAKDKVCYQYQIILPNKDAIMKDAPLECFDTLMDNICAEAKTTGLRVKIRGSKIVFNIGRNRFKRKKGLQWILEKREYTCSSLINALFAHFGIDISKKLGKDPQYIAPGDFLHSHYFSQLT